MSEVGLKGLLWLIVFDGVLMEGFFNVFFICRVLK